MYIYIYIYIIVDSDNTLSAMALTLDPSEENIYFVNFAATASIPTVMQYNLADKSIRGNIYIHI